MSSSVDVLKDGSVNKTPHQSSLKEVPRTFSVDGIENEAGNLDYHEQRGFTRHDRRDMDRMGKVQELRRNFRPLSTLSFTVILQSTWEILMVATTEGLTDGGLAGLFWSYVWTFFGFGMVVFSLAEMSSMAPTSGGQYHWVSEFAPPKYQKVLSYITGWMSTLSWQAGTASGPFLVGTIIQALLTINNPNYVPTNWQGTLFVFAVTLAVWLANVYGSRAMPMLQNLMLVVHVLGFFVVIIVLWVLAPRNTATVVFTSFTNDGGWSTMGLSLMVGQISAIYGLICSDGAAHISEEIKDAAVTVPRAMVGSYLLNGALGLVFIITYLFCITNLEEALNDESTFGYPFLWVFRNAVSMPAVNGLSFIVLLVLFVGTVSFNLSTSRQTWAFARDLGLPFSDWLAHVDPKLQVPAHSVTFTCLFTIALSLINIGSDVAFGAIISLNLVSLMLTYSVSIGCVLFRRLRHPELLPHARWSLGKWGVPVNMGGLAYSTFAFFWCFWPNTTPVDLESFNWAVVMFVGVAVLCFLFYAVKARKVFKGPVVLVEGWRMD